MTGVQYVDEAGAVTQINAKAVVLATGGMSTNKELLAYVLAFPIYMLSYVPISFQAVFAKSEWKPIEHKG